MSTAPLVSERLTVDTPITGTSFVIDRSGAEDGPHIVWLHDAFGAIDTPPGLDALAATTRVHEVHLPGWDVAPGGDRFDTLGELAHAAWWVFDQLGIDRPIIAGHGFGATVAVELAIHQPSRVAALALAAPFGMFDAADPGVDIFALLPRDLYPAMYADPAGDLVARHFPPTSDPHERGLASIRRVEVLGATSRYLFPIPDTNVAGRAYCLADVPMTVLFGALDGVVPRSLAGAWRAAFPHAQISVIDDVSHMLPFENDVFAESFVRLAHERRGGEHRLMDFSPDEDHSLIAHAVRRRCADFDDTYWAACEENHQFPWDFYSAMATDGWVGMALPEAFGGGGRGITEAAIMLKEVAASGAAMNGCSALHLTVFGLQPVVKFGNDRLQQTFLPRAASGDLHVAFGVTEPNTGTDTSRISTRAVRGDDGVWRISGQKIWTTKALEAEVILILVRTGHDPDDRFGGLTLFLADMDPAHVTIRPTKKVGRNAVTTGETFYDELPVEDWRMVGEEGRGFHHILSGLNPERILIAAEAVGIGEASLRRAVGYASEREVFGRMIGSNQAISHPLADSYARLQAAWQMVLLAGWRYDNGLSCGEAANTAKYLAAEAGFDAADRAMQTHGGLGYACEYHVERYWREARLMRIAPVSQEMTLNYLAQNVLGLPRSY